jgi:hypothetical protein
MGHLPTSLNRGTRLRLLRRNRKRSTVGRVNGREESLAWSDFYHSLRSIYCTLPSGACAGSWFAIKVDNPTLTRRVCRAVTDGYLSTLVHHAL